MTIQVFGPRGMLGQAVCAAAQRRGHAVEDAAVNLEIVTAGHIHAETVINCAGIVKQRQCSASHMLRVNAVGAQLLAEACDAAGARLIQVSSDCVFAGRAYGPHIEISAVDPDDDYAKSKLAGEVIRPPHLTIRTSFVGFGLHGLIARMQRPNVVERASAYQHWSGHTVETVADVLITLAERSELTGLLHIPGEFQTRWQLCNALKVRYDLPAQIMLDNSYESDRRLESIYWSAWGLPDLPDFATQLELMPWPNP